MLFRSRFLTSQPPSKKTLIMAKSLFGFLLILTFSASTSHSQQNYSGDSIWRCNNSDQTGPSPSFLYTCNNELHSCRSFLLFRTKPPNYLSLSSISNLTSSDPNELSKINNISSTTILPPNKELIIPVKCSCSGQYYQANTSYIYPSVDETYLSIANDTFQGLTTCDELIRENPYNAYDLIPGLVIKVPLRCACPTKKQIENGTKFLLTFLVSWNDTVGGISDRFNVSAKDVSLANGLPDEKAVLYPFTTLLIPLSNEPLISQMRSYQPIAPSYRKPLQEKRHDQKSHKGLYVGVGSGAFLAILCFLSLLAVFHYRRERRSSHEDSRKFREGQKKQKLPEKFLNKVVKNGEILKIYTYEELMAATDNFSPRKRLSDSIYRGNLRGKMLAVKRTNADVAKEIKILGNINHFNVIALYGVCEHDGDFYLVYEYLEEGSLWDWLHNKDPSIAHNWSQRFLIALDVANGLDYLHNFTSPAYVHKGISSRNILLKRDLRAKIAHFGFARENTNSQITSIVGEKGYIAPEYMHSGKVNPKVDVYAFGVVLLEMITGKEAVFVGSDGDEVLLSEAVISTMDGGNVGADIVNGLIDPRLEVKHPLGYVIDHAELALRLLKLSVACLAREPENRLSMAGVVSYLMRIQPDIPNFQYFSVE